jgi:hypothetical protein
MLVVIEVKPGRCNDISQSYWLGDMAEEYVRVIVFVGNAIGFKVGAPEREVRLRKA